MKNKYLILFLVAAVVGYFVYVNAYTEFKPVAFANDAHEYFDVQDDSLFRINLKKVLDYNNVSYQMKEDGNILVKRKILHDKERLLNYTKKAMDTAWIKSHTH